jgi:CHAD domain-containing protein
MGAKQFNKCCPVTVAVASFLVHKLIERTEDELKKKETRAECERELYTIYKEIKKLEKSKNTEEEQVQIDIHELRKAYKRLRIQYCSDYDDDDTCEDQNNIFEKIVKIITCRC